VDELDRILASEDGLEPSSGFASAVMAEVRRQAAEPPPLRFPWVRFALGLSSCVAMAGLAGVVILPVIESRLDELSYAATATLVSLLIGCAPVLRVRLSKSRFIG